MTFKYSKRLVDGYNVYTGDIYRINKESLNDDTSLIYPNSIIEKLNMDYMEIEVLRIPEEESGIKLMLSYKHNGEVLKKELLKEILEDDVYNKISELDLFKDNEIKCCISVEDDLLYVNKILNEKSLIRVTEIPKESKEKKHNFYTLLGKEYNIKEEIEITLTEEEKEEIKERSLLMRSEEDEYISKKEKSPDVLIFKVVGVDELGKLDFKFIPKMADGSVYKEYHYDYKKVMDFRKKEIENKIKRIDELKELGYEIKECKKKVEEEGYLAASYESLQEATKDLSFYNEIEVTEIFVNLSIHSGIETIMKFLNNGCILKNK